MSWPPTTMSAAPALDSVVITIDVDWAPDFAIEQTAAILLEQEVRATWFVTHESAAVDALRAHPDQFELGIHPNFLPSSSHGSTPVEVLDHCVGLVPDAVSMRTHGLVQSTALLDLVLERTTVRTDVSLFTPRMPGVRPFVHWSSLGALVRLPYVWEDDVEGFAPDPVWQPEPVLALAGLRVFDFHPIHVALNTSSLEPYRRLKAVHPHVTDISAAELERYAGAEVGTRTMLAALAERVAELGTAELVRDVGRRTLHASCGEAFK